MVGGQTYVTSPFSDPVPSTSNQWKGQKHKHRNLSCEITKAPSALSEFRVHVGLHVFSGLLNQQNQKCCPWIKGWEWWRELWQQTLLARVYQQSNSKKNTPAWTWLDFTSQMVWKQDFSALPELTLSSICQMYDAESFRKWVIYTLFCNYGSCFNFFKHYLAHLSHTCHTLSDEHSYQVILVIQHTFFPAKTFDESGPNFCLVSIWVVCQQHACS